MKKIYFALIIMGLMTTTSCEKLGLPSDEKTTYTYTNNLDMSSVQQYISSWTDQIREYDGSGSCIAFNTISPLSQRSRTFTANSNAVKVKVYVDIRFKSTYTQKKKWVQHVYYLEKGGNTNIRIDNNTLMGLYEP